jgi:hypothetical protein
MGALFSPANPAPGAATPAAPTPVIFRKSRRVSRAGNSHSLEFTKQSYFKTAS